MRWILLSLGLGLGACKEPVAPPIGDFEDPGGDRFTLDPPVVGVGTTVNMTIRSRLSQFEFGDSSMNVLGGGLEIRDFAVLDGFTAIAEVSIADDAELGVRDAVVEAGVRDWSVSEALQVIEESFTISPDNAKMGEVIDVRLLGRDTDWVNIGTWASFGRDVDTLSVDVISPTELVARIAIRSDAQPGFRDITVEQDGGALTLYDGLTVDRAVITASFDPPVVQQGETFNFRIEGVNTRFEEDFLAEQLAFWNRGSPVADIVIREFRRVDDQTLEGVMQASTAAQPGFRDLFIDDVEDLLVGNAVEITPVPPDPFDAVIGMSFGVRRTINPVTGFADDQVRAFVFFIIPTDPPCGPPFVPSVGPVPFDINGVFPVPPEPEVIDCPEPLTVSAGEQVFFESDENVITLHREINGSTGQIIYRGRNLTLNDYKFGLEYDLRAPGDPDGVPEFVIEDAQPTVPENYLITEPNFANLEHNRFEAFDFSWTSAGVYPTGLFTIGVSGTLEETGEGGFVGVLPFDDGHHSFGPNAMSQLQPGRVEFTAISRVEGRVFEVPFSGRMQQSSSSLSTSANFDLVGE